VKKGLRLLACIAFTVSFFSAVPNADALTLLQENLVGLANRFSVTVSDFEPDGPLTPDSVKSMVEEQLTNAKLNLLSRYEAPPLSHINVNVIKTPRNDEDEYDYLIDVNVYNISTIRKQYELRKGTVWMMGSYRVTPGENFPADVELQIKRIIRFFIGDYYAANPSVAGR